MHVYGVSETVSFTVIDTTTGKPARDVAGTLTLRVVKDGVSAPATGTPVGNPGWTIHKLTLSAAEKTSESITIEGDSSNADYAVIPRHLVVYNPQLLEDVADDVANLPDESEIAVAVGALDAAGTRAALGLAAANLDTQLSGQNSTLQDISDDVLNLPDESEIAAAVQVLLASIHGDGSWEAGESTIPQEVIDAIKAIRAKTDLIGTGKAKWIDNGFDPCGTLRIVRGDSYGGAHGKSALTIVDLEDEWPNLDEVESITLTIRGVRRRRGEEPPVMLSVVGDVGETDGHQSAGFEVTAAQSATMTPGTFQYDIEARWADGSAATIVGPDAVGEVLHDQTVVSVSVD